MEEKKAHAAGQQEDRRGAERTEEGGDRGTERDESVGPRPQCRPTEADERGEEDSQHHRSETIQSPAQDRAHADRGVCDRERQHDEEGRSREAQPGQQAAPPAAPHIPQEDAELRGRRAGQDVDQRHAFQEARLGRPLPPFLKLRLHDAHDGGASVGGRSDLEKADRDLLPGIAERLSHRASPPCRARRRRPSRTPRSPPRRPAARSRSCRRS